MTNLRVIGTFLWFMMDLFWALEEPYVAVVVGTISIFLHVLLIQSGEENWQTTSWIAFNLSWLLNSDIIQTNDSKYAMWFLGVVAILLTFESIRKKKPIKSA